MYNFCQVVINNEMLGRDEIGKKGSQCIWSLKSSRIFAIVCLRKVGLFFGFVQKKEKSFRIENFFQVVKKPL